MYSVRSNRSKRDRVRLHFGLRCASMAMILGLGAGQVLAEYVEQQKLTASDADGEDRFGASVSVSGDTTVVGAYGYGCAAGNYCGSAYVYRFNGTSWVEEQMLTASDPVEDNWFGRSVSVSGDKVVVAARGDESAYVFRFNGTSWVEEQKLTASDASSNTYFGSSVSVSGDTALVSASGDESAYVFRFNGTSWVEEQKLTTSDEAASRNFGISVSVSGDTALVGARHDDCAVGLNCGSAYVFRFNGTSWVEEQKLTASDAAASDTLGFSVSVSGDTAVMGATGDACTAGFGCGAAYVFRFNGTSWVEEQKLSASDAGEFNLFGISVSVSGDTALVGASEDDCPAGTFCGSAYEFRFNGTSWVERHKLTASDAAAHDYFGISVSVSGDAGVVGAYRDDCAEGGFCGSAYTFQSLPASPIPTASTWGLVSLTLLLVAAGTIVIRRTANSSGSGGRSIETGA